jgi:hypothetical protein
VNHGGSGGFSGFGRSDCVDRRFMGEGARAGRVPQIRDGEEMMIDSIVFVSLLAAGLLSFFQVLFIADEIFPSMEEKHYMKQWIPAIGVFYSFYLRKKFGFRKGCVWCEYKGSGYFYNLETREFACWGDV